MLYFTLNFLLGILYAYIKKYNQLMSDKIYFKNLDLESLTAKAAEIVVSYCFAFYVSIYWRGRI